MYDNIIKIAHRAGSETRPKSISEARQNGSRVNGRLRNA